ncbi:MAG: leucine-rich repeat protein, partial [Ruminococcus sp.]
MRAKRFMSVILSLLIVCSSFAGLTVFADETGPHTYTVIGDATFLSDKWNPRATADDLALQYDGTYKITYTGVAKSDCYTVNVVEDHAWDNSFGKALGDDANIKFSVPEDDSTVEIILTIQGTKEKEIGGVLTTVNDGFVEILVNGAAAPDKIIPDITEHYVAGMAGLCNGISWNVAAPENKMIDMGDGSYEITFTGVQPTNEDVNGREHFDEEGNPILQPYEFKVTTNGTWAPAYGYDGKIPDGGANAQLMITESDSTVKIVLTSDLFVEAYINGTKVSPDPETTTNGEGKIDGTTVNGVNCNIGDIITYTYYLKTPGKFNDFQGTFEYSSGLKIRDLKFTDKKGIMTNIKNSGIAYYNGTSCWDPYDFTTSKVFFTAEFEVIDEGEQTIKNNMYIISGVNGIDYYSYGVNNGCVEKFETKVVNAPTTYGGGIYFPKNDIQTNRYFFKFPVDEEDFSGNVHNWKTFSNATATCFWWDGTDACESWQKSYRMKTTDLPNIYYIDVPTNVGTIIFTNGIYGGEAPAEGEVSSPNWGKNCQTVNINSDYYDPSDNPNYPDGTTTFNNMIYVVDVNNVSYNEHSKAPTYGGEWRYLHSDGTIDYTPGTIYKPKEISVTTDKTELTLKTGTSTFVKTTVRGGDLGYTTEWKSDNPDVADVDQNGEITAKNKGTATITVRVQNPGSETDVAQAEMIVNVVDLLYEKITGETGDCTWTFDEETNTLTILGNGEMGDYYWYGECPWLDFCEDIKNIVIENGVTSIGDRAFSHCTSLTSVTIGDSVTSIGISAFNCCTSLTSVTIPDSVTSIDDCAFSDCTSLTGVTIPDSVTSIGTRAFYDCGNLMGVYITDLKSWCNIYFRYSDSNPLYYGGNLYLNGELVTDLVIPYGVTSIGDEVFNGCTSLTSVTIPDSVTRIGNYAFYDCENLMGVYITDLKSWCNIKYGDDYSYSNSHGNPLFYAENLYLNGNLVTDLVIPYGVTSIRDEAFNGCTSLTSVTIPDSVTSIGYEAFCDCTGLASVTIGNSVTNIGNGAFKGCTSLENILIPDSVEGIGEYAFNRCTSLTSVTIPDGVTSIGGYAFNNCSNLSSVLMSSNIESIGESAFENCISLNDVYYGKSKNYWNNIRIGNYNTCLTGATIHYNCHGYSQEISVTQQQYKLTYGAKPFNLNAKAETGLSYVSDNTSVAEVSADGTVTINGVGSATITITAEETANYNSATATVEITVNKVGQEVSVDKQDYKLTYGSKPFNLNAKAETALSYVSDNTSVAEVSADGTVTIKGVGSATITITAEETANYN